MYSSASTAEPLAAGYLLGLSAASRCGALPVHPILQYLFMVDGVHAMVSLASRRSLGGAGDAGAQAFSRLFRAGVSVMLCSEDPTISQQTDDPLEAEYCLARTMVGLSEADLAELAHNSVALFNTGASKLTADCRGAVDVAQEDNNESPAESCRTIRERYREGRRSAELSMLARLAPRATAASHAISLGSRP
uniref:Amidohydrolase-related domain-containing protein n=1 Tax=Alexandrium andersonii TaxID=327968 RepID=A0A7S2BNF3_9DINO